MNNTSKPNNREGGSATDGRLCRPRPECSFGFKCYRKNPYHFQDFNHKHLNDILDRQQDSDDIVIPRDIPSDISTTDLKQQLIILKNIRNKSSGQKTENVSEASTSRDPTKEDEQAKRPKTEKRESQTNERKRRNEEPAPSRGPDPAKMQKMAREATKHHGDVLAKWEASLPYNFFLTSIQDSVPTHSEPLTITFTELLDSGLGELESSLQINFMIELGWLLAQYYFTGNRFKPLTIIYGTETEDLHPSAKLPDNITAVQAKPPTAFGHHHTKMSILSYTDNSIRVIVSTANLVESDWENRTQGLWISPRCPRLPEGADTGSGESPTKFKQDLLRYLSAYRLPQLEQWILRVRLADFSSVKVFLVSSVPGSHNGPNLRLWGHNRLGAILKEHAVGLDEPKTPWRSWPILGQFSSIGSLGPDPGSWFCGELLDSFGKAKVDSLQGFPPFRLIYPSYDLVKRSHDGLLGGACLPYSRRTHVKQPWLKRYLYDWKSDSRHRTKAVPHIKSYGRFSPCGSFLSWFCLTSANLSKAAWGSVTSTKQNGVCLRILSYEVGVLFLPKFLVDDAVFEMEHTPETLKTPPSSNLLTGHRKEYQPFPLPYDIPIVKYADTDEPWVSEYLQ